MPSVFYPTSFGKKNDCLPSDLKVYVLEERAARMALPEHCWGEGRCRVYRTNVYVPVFKSCIRLAWVNTRRFFITESEATSIK